MIKVISSGLYTSIQDLGRFGHRKQGVPLSGAMDLFSAQLANRLVGNELYEPLIEITLLGPILQFDQDTLMSLTGADLSPKLNGEPVPMNKAFIIKSGGELRFGAPVYGARCYLAVSGGIKAEKSLGSCSAYKGITSTVTLKKGAVLETVGNFIETIVPNTSIPIAIEHLKARAIPVFPGPEFQLLPNSLQKNLNGFEFTVGTESNRMAYILNERVSFQIPEIITGPVQPGTVQLTPSGKLIVLMRDAQTTGGYARILQLSEDGINTLAQKKPGDSAVFQLL